MAQGNESRHVSDAKGNSCALATDSTRHGSLSSRHFANALGLEEDDDLSSDSGDDTDRDSDGRPTDPDDNPALAVQDFQYVAQSDLRQPLTYVHPAVKAVGGVSGVLKQCRRRRKRKISREQE